MVEQADRLLGVDGCLNFFAGPTETRFAALLNFHKVHYSLTHVAGTSGGNKDDMRESLDLMAAGKVDPATMVTHIGGLNAVPETTLNLPQIPGGKKLIYTHIRLPLTALADFDELGKKNPLFAQLADRVRTNKGLWSAEAEHYLRLRRHHCRRRTRQSCGRRHQAHRFYLGHGRHFRRDCVPLRRIRNSDDSCRA